MKKHPKIDIQSLWGIEHDLMYAFKRIENVQERFNLLPGADLSIDSLHPKISCTLHKIISQLKSSLKILRKHYPELKILDHNKRDNESRELLNEILKGRKAPKYDASDIGIPMLDE